MPRVLYLTNCSSGIFNQSNIWAASRLCTSKGLIHIPQVTKNLSHFLCEAGYEVNVITNTYERVDPHERACFDPRAKILETPDIISFFRRLCYGTSVAQTRYFAYPNLFIVPALAEVVNFNNYDMVICDSRTEYVGLNRKMWHSILSYHKNSNNGALKEISKCINMHDAINWIDSPAQTESSKNMGDKKLFYSENLVREQIRPSLDKLDNFFYVFTEFKKEGTVNYADTLSKLFEKHSAEEMLDCLFSKIPKQQTRYHIDEFITEDMFSKLPEVISARSAGKIDRTTFFKRFNSSMLSCSAKDLYVLTNNALLIDDKPELDKYKKYFFGSLRLTNEGYQAISEEVSSLLS